MAAFTFNIAKGKVNGYHDRVVDNDPADSALVVVILKANESDAILKDYDDLGALLGAAGNTEADFTNYARKVLTDSDLSASTVDDTNDRREADIPDQTWTSAGGTTDNTTTKILICYDADTAAGTDSSIVPLTCSDFAVTTNGSNLQATIDSAGYFRAS